LLKPVSGYMILSRLENATFGAALSMPEEAIGKFYNVAGFSARLPARRTSPTRAENGKAAKR
jgi:hypothetical protein